MFTVTEDDLTSADVIALLALHLSGMTEQTPAEHVHALPLDALLASDVTFYAARSDGDLAAIGAIKDLGNGTAELKSMRAAPHWRGRGAGNAVLLHLLAVARARGYRWVGLETGQQAGFADAHRLYERHGFTDCGDFGGYRAGEYTRLMGLTL